MSQFQYTRIRKADIYKLFKDINKTLTTRLSDDKFEEKWKVYSDDFYKKIKKIGKPTIKAIQRSTKTPNLNSIAKIIEKESIRDPIDFLVGCWKHYWDPNYKNKCIILIGKDGKYTIDRGYRTKFEIRNALFTDNKIIFDLWDIVGGYLDSKQILEIKGKNLLEGYIAADKNNPRKYIRLQA